MKRTKLRVLMLSDYFYPHVGGGVEKVVYELSKRLVGFGCNVSVITLGNVCSSYTVDGVEVHMLPSIDLTKLFHLQLSIPKDIRTAVRIVRNYSPDIIHAHNIFFTTS
ncbi:MAG: glycosyltransferase, partial [Candidatus Bathyarchaeia archaeon]